MEIKNAYSGEVVYSERYETYEQILPKLVRAREGQKKWKELSVRSRVEAMKERLERIAPSINSHAFHISTQVLKPISQATQELQAGLDKLRYCTKIAEEALSEIEKEDKEKGMKYRIGRESKGVVYTIAPWNYPFFTALNSIGPALLSGNSVILKHQTAPSTGQLFEEMFNEMAGISGLCQHLYIDVPTSDKLVLEQDIDHIVFTGSVRGGQLISSLLAKRANNLHLREPFLQSSLELGSSDAAYVAEDADIEKAASMLITVGRLHNSGQSCCSTKRLILHSNIAHHFMDIAKRIFDSQVMGDPLNQHTTLGPLHGGPKAVEQMVEFIEDARSKGAKVEIGGDTFQKDGYTFILPTLLTNINSDMRVWQEEVFGPVLPVSVVSSDDEALLQLPHPFYGLTTSVFTNNKQLEDKVIKGSRSGTVFINWCNDVQPEVAW
eukprot:CAMPEP_0174273556 /NCGR_PEP_ID=MMETSP0439-20130205/54928_1 /TAXON_ID=0 /ORGANISM="Stereomyxa ramosa, Strain Chinc5" /LENGTH=436 /DNA_ID=CAMNT_0015364779 /DNA_START=36 /DNA_END=1343 /DNA_ORIENTATION=-